MNQNYQLRKAHADHLRCFEWDHEATLTFKFLKASIDFSFTRLENWANGLGWIARGPVAWVGVPEETPGGLHHLHCLLRGTSGIPTRLMEARWRRRNGLCLIREYVPGLGVEDYVVKEVSIEVSEGRFSSNFDATRRLA